MADPELVFGLFYWVGGFFGFFEGRGGKGWDVRKERRLVLHSNGELCSLFSNTGLLRILLSREQLLWSFLKILEADDGILLHAFIYFFIFELRLTCTYVCL